MHQRPISGNIIKNYGPAVRDNRYTDLLKYVISFLRIFFKDLEASFNSNNLILRRNFITTLASLLKTNLDLYLQQRIAAKGKHSD